MSEGSSLLKKEQDLPSGPFKDLYNDVKAELEWHILFEDAFPTDAKLLEVAKGQWDPQADTLLIEHELALTDPTFRLVS